MQRARDGADGENLALQVAEALQLLARPLELTGAGGLRESQRLTASVGVERRGALKPVLRAGSRLSQARGRTRKPLSNPGCRPSSSSWPERVGTFGCNSQSATTTTMCSPLGSRHSVSRPRLAFRSQGYRLVSDVS